MVNYLCCVFTEEGTPPLRSFSDDAGTFWFISRDVFELLEITGIPKALSRLEAHDKRAIGPGNPYGMARNCLAISEQGLYELTVTSRKPEAKAFKARILNSISPTLRLLARASK